MKRKRFLQLHIGRIALTFLLLCLIIYTCYHALWSSEGSLLTTPAKPISDTRLISGDAWLFRDETVLTVPKAGLVNSLADGGAKVGKNTELTEVWFDESGVELNEKQAKLDLINRTIDVLEASTLPEGTPVSKAEGYRAQALSELSKIRMAIRTGDLSGLSEMEDALLVSLNRYGALTGDADAIAKALESARAERDALLKGEKTVLHNTASSAYYYGLSEVDGYESVFTEQALEAMTAESFAEMTRATPDTGEGYPVGKLCYGYSWHVAVDFSQACEDLFVIGQAYTVSFPENNGMTLELVCERLIGNGEGGTVAVLRSDVTPLEFRYLRMQSAEITVGSTEGIYIPRQAYVSLGGLDGVYVFEDGTVRFRRILVIYQDEGYLIANYEDNAPEHDAAYLSLNDLMITSGKNLYDGKVYS
ncbi:MAG: hypothetical protein IKC59_01250 [Clostridia bacterium]|nr:hypothetical protein [Clostridia bacterium]